MKNNTFGYEFNPSKYSPAIGYSQLRVCISDQPTQRFFDSKYLRLPTFDGRFFHQTQISRHELALQETFQVCLGALSLVSHSGETLRGFSFGGVLQTKVVDRDLECELTSTAPIFKLQDNPKVVGRLVVDEIMDLLAEMQVSLPHHEDELYSRLAKIAPYQVFLSCLISLQRRADAVPMNLRHDKYHQLVSELHKVNGILRAADGWDGTSPGLEELIAG